MKITPTLKNSIIILLLLAGNLLLAQEASINITRDKKIDALLLVKREVETSARKYKIQIFSGPSRSDAEKSRKEFSENFPDIESSIEYETPNYKIWVGEFRNRLEADKSLIGIKKIFANAFIFKPKSNDEQPVNKKEAP